MGKYKSIQKIYKNFLITISCYLSYFIAWYKWFQVYNQIKSICSHLKIIHKYIIKSWVYDFEASKRKK